MNLRTYILSLLGLSAIMYVVIKVFPDEYSTIKNPVVYTVTANHCVPSAAIQKGKNGSDYVWVETKKCFAKKREIEIHNINKDTIFVISGLSKGEKILVFEKQNKL